MIKRVLKRKFGRAWKKRRRASIRGCRRRSTMKIACRVKWSVLHGKHAKAGYRGKVTVKFISSRGRIKRAGYRLSVLKRTPGKKRKRRVSRAGSLRYTPKDASALVR